MSKIIERLKHEMLVRVSTFVTRTACDRRKSPIA